METLARGAIFCLPGHPGYEMEGKSEPLQERQAVYGLEQHPIPQRHDDRGRTIEFCTWFRAQYSLSRALSFYTQPWLVQSSRPTIQSDDHPTSRCMDSDSARPEQCSVWDPHFMRLRSRPSLGAYMPRLLSGWFLRNVISHEGDLAAK